MYQSSDFPPNTVLLLNDIVEKLRKPSRLERVNRHKLARSKRVSEALQVRYRGMSRGVNDLPRIPLSSSHFVAFCVLSSFRYPSHIE